MLKDTSLIDIINLLSNSPLVPLIVSKLSKTEKSGGFAFVNPPLESLPFRAMRIINADFSGSN